VIYALGMWGDHGLSLNRHLVWLLKEPDTPQVIIGTRELELRHGIYVPLQAVGRTSETTDGNLLDNSAVETASVSVALSCSCPRAERAFFIVAAFLADSANFNSSFCVSHKLT